MELEALTPLQAINKAYLKEKTLRPNIDLFKANLNRLINNIDDEEYEENAKTHIRDFLLDTYYRGSHAINTKDRKDLVIHIDNEAKHPVGVILEAKSPSNKHQFPTLQNLNVKAMHELMLYYLRERVDNNNANIVHLIITNGYEWYVFNGSQFYDHFFRSSKLITRYKEWTIGKKDSKKTELFYEDIAKPFLSKLQSKLTFTYFHIRDYEKALKSKDNSHDGELTALYKFLSPVSLLNTPFSNDSNTLDEPFYNELLHILGLIEKKIGTKKIIQRKEKSKRNLGSLLENTINMLNIEQRLPKVETLSIYGTTKAEQYFGVGLQLSITWLNRILFLKLLEAQLLKYHDQNSEYKFLTSDRVRDYDILNKLFFQVLARTSNERTDAVNKEFGKIPYLNSSLFEISPLEDTTIRINSLEDDLEIPYHTSTVLTDGNGKRRKGQCGTLTYLFNFLDAYDFTSEGSDEIQEDNKTLINASVLGLIFEKINGYKEGSYFTPGYVTMYMCNETIRSVILQKFNSYYSWTCKNFTNLYNKIDDIEEANNIVNSLKICDPAVGSGHFLVSALNEIISIKADLGILTDADGKKLKGYNISIENDDLIITDEDNLIFEYKPGNTEKHRIQKAMFIEKQTIIENCLFGVDINPNSVNICRLRLWIELLKNSYYTINSAGKELHTLPNIDINIKLGNSLVSRFTLKDDLQKSFKGTNFTLSDYTQAVKTYKDTSNRKEKTRLLKIIHEVKNNFNAQFYNKMPENTKLAKLRGQLTNIQTANRDLFGEKLSQEVKKIEEKKLTKQVTQQEAIVKEIKDNVVYRSALEWRFEFPEVLDENGNYLGFDIVIGNPPYGVSIKDQLRKVITKLLGKVPDYQIHYHFINLAHNLINDHNQMSLIIPNSLLFNVYAKKYRLSLFKDWNIVEILDCTDFAIFNDATVRNIILNVQKGNSTTSVGYRNTKTATSFDQLISNPRLTVSHDNLKKNNQNWALVFKLDPETLELTDKIRNGAVSLTRYFPEQSQGLIAYDKYQGQTQTIIESRAFHSERKINDNYMPWLWGEDVTRYQVKWNGKEYINYCDEIANPRDSKYFVGKRLLIREITNPTIYAAITKKELYNDPAIIIIKDRPKSEIPLEAVLGILNSQLASFLHFNTAPKATKGAFPKILVEDINNFPIPKMDKDNKGLFLEIAKLAKILQKTPTTTNKGTESKMNNTVNKLYRINNDQVKMIERYFAASQIKT